MLQIHGNVGYLLAVNVNKSTFVMIRIERNTAKTSRFGQTDRDQLAIQNCKTVVRKTAHPPDWALGTVHCFWNTHCSFSFRIMIKIALIARNQSQNSRIWCSRNEPSADINQADINRRFITNSTVHTPAFANAPLVNFKKFEFEFRLIF